MSSRFGAANPSRARNAKLKILFACLAFFFLLLICALVFVLNNAGTAPATEPVAVAATEDDSSVGVLIPKFRIERGVQITMENFDQFFRVDPFPKDQVPLGAVTAAQRHLVIDRFAVSLIKPNVPLQLEDVGTTKPLDLIEIPAGYRLITILVDHRSGVEGFAKPGSRVDVLWTFEQAGAKKVATIADFVKVVSVAGNVQIVKDGQPAPVAANAQVTVSLLVTEKQAKYVELARTAGQLSLVLVGDGVAPPTETEAATPVTIDEILGQKAQAVTEEVPPDGIMIVGDKKYVLRKGRWQLVVD